MIQATGEAVGLVVVVNVICRMFDRCSGRGC